MGGRVARAGRPRHRALWEPRRLVQFGLWGVRDGSLEEGMSGLTCEG